MNNVAVKEFDELQFEKKLSQLKDSQDSINTCCQWCLVNRAHHKKIVTAWLNVLKRVKIEHRLTLFYLANDVIQYSKRKRYEFVESWATALQKATTMVRDDRVKHKILRIFKIWEERSVYSEEFVSDLCGLISVTPTAPKNEEPHEFQPSYVIQKIKTCSKLENDTDQKLKVLKQKTPKIIENDSITSTLKDRAHLDDAEKEIESYVKKIEEYINALKAEIKNRITLITVLKQADVQLETDKKDVKVVANAYKSFGQRVKTFKKKLEEHMETLASPIPSPDINAPSPNSDSDIDLPDENALPTSTLASDHNNQPVQITNANFYTPVPPPTTEPSSFTTNGFSSFLGSNLAFNDFNFTSSLYSNNKTTSNITNTTNSTFNSLSNLLPNLALGQPPPPPAVMDKPPYQMNNQTPLLPPPLPLFDAKEENYGGGLNYDSSYIDTSTTDYGSGTYTENSYKPYNQPQSDIYDPMTVYGNEKEYEAPQGANPYPPPPVDEYNPEQEMETWETDNTWTQLPLDSETPESPPPFEKEAFGNNPVEYHDSLGGSGMTDVDHRILPAVKLEKTNGRSKDVDHRNLISLIGSPMNDSNSNPLISQDVWNGNDQDFRNPANSVSMGDQDFRLSFNIDNIKLPPPPPPPHQQSSTIQILSNVSVVPPSKKPAYKDIVESIDMELSDEDECNGQKRDNLKAVLDGRKSNNPGDAKTEALFNKTDMGGFSQTSLEPPPPLPEFPDDCEENMFLEDLANDISLNEFFVNPTVNEKEEMQPTDNNMWNNFPPPHLPMMANMSGMRPPSQGQMPPPPPLLPIPNNWMPPNHMQQDCNNYQQNYREPRGRGGNFRGDRGNRGGFGFQNKGRGRGFMNHRGGRGWGMNTRGPRGGPRFRGNFRGNYRGGF